LIKSLFYRLFRCFYLIFIYILVKNNLNYKNYLPNVKGHAENNLPGSQAKHHGMRDLLLLFVRFVIVYMRKYIMGRDELGCARL
jgi:hypothetical protein